MDVIRLQAPSSVRVQSIESVQIFLVYWRKRQSGKGIIMEKATAFPQKQLPDKAARHKLFGSVTPTEKTKPVEKADMADLQNTRKDFLFDIDTVGVTNVKHPITVNSHLLPNTQTTVGTITFTSSLKNSSKGINMSRFTQQLQTSHEAGFTADISSLKQFTKD